VQLRGAFLLLPATLCLLLRIPAVSEAKLFKLFSIVSVLIPHTELSLLPPVSVWPSFY